MAETTEVKQSITAILRKKPLIKYGLVISLLVFASGVYFYFFKKPPVSPETYLQQLIVEQPLICQIKLSGKPSEKEKQECARAKGTIRCGNGVCWCVCPPQPKPTLEPRQCCPQNCQCLSCSCPKPSPKPSLLPIPKNKPICSAIGSKSEGWYLDGGLIKWDNCAKCEAVCQAVGSRSEGWYSSCNGNLIQYAQCGSLPSPKPSPKPTRY